MIPINRNHVSAPNQDVRTKIVGLGGAGANALDRIMLDGLPGAELVAINTDVQALTGSVATDKVQIGRTTTRGLGAGGDPEIGYAAAEEGMEEVRQALEGAQMVFLCVGLGGGTGSGGARIVASVAREHNALVIAIATLPFSFEGRRRREQAEEALGALQEVADVVICFENDKMGDAVSPTASIQDAFAAADETISQSVRAIAGLMQQRGLVHIGFDELVTALQGSPGARCLFGYGEAEGDNRANDALASALKNPLMDKGRMLDDAQNVLVNIAGGPSMTLNEVQILMEELNRHIGDDTRILFGTAVDARLGKKMAVTILSSLDAPEGAAPAVAAAARTAGRAESAPAAAPVAAPAVQAAEPEPVSALMEEEDDFAEAFVEREADEPGMEAAAMAAGAQSAAAAKAAKGKQEQMQFEPVTRGRFEKSEPTIVDGQDLDVPTFLRRNMKVK